MDRPDVRRDVLADRPVAARRGPREDAVLVHERDRQAVDLQLGDEYRHATQAVRHALEPRLQLLAAVRIVEREERDLVPHARQLGNGRPAHALRRRVRRDEPGMLSLERFQLAHEGVVLGVRDLGPGLRVVEAVVPPDLVPQLRRARRGNLHFRDGLRHGEILGCSPVSIRARDDAAPAEAPAPLRSPRPGCGLRAGPRRRGVARSPGRLRTRSRRR